MVESERASTASGALGEPGQGAHGAIPDAATHGAVGLNGIAAARAESDHRDAPHAAAGRMGATMGHAALPAQDLKPETG